MFLLCYRLKRDEIEHGASFACVLVVSFNAQIFKFLENILSCPTVSHVEPSRAAFSCAQNLVVALAVLRATFLCSKLKSQEVDYAPKHTLVNSPTKHALVVPHSKPQHRCLVSLEARRRRLSSQNERPTS